MAPVHPTHTAVAVEPATSRAATVPAWIRATPVPRDAAPDLFPPPYLRRLRLPHLTRAAAGHRSEPARPPCLSYQAVMSPSSAIDVTVCKRKDSCREPLPHADRCRIPARSARRAEKLHCLHALPEPTACATVFLVSTSPVANLSRFPPHSLATSPFCRALVAAIAAIIMLQSPYHLVRAR